MFTNTHTHTETSLRYIGIEVLLEKPLCPTQKRFLCYSIRPPGNIDHHSGTNASTIFAKMLSQTNLPLFSSTVEPISKNILSTTLENSLLARRWVLENEVQSGRFFLSIDNNNC